MIFTARQFTFTFPRPALIMGIVNVTPDSFADGGKFLDADRAADRALELVRQGADIVDIGGESTRPGATPVSETEELRRVLPVLERLAGRVRVPLSIDTMKPAVARAALAAGASIVNDVAAAQRGGAGLPTEDAMWRAVAEFGAGYVLMHMQGTPRTMQANPSYENVLAEVEDFFARGMHWLSAAGVTAEQVVLDAGIGFGKTAEHNLQLLAGLRGFTRLRRPLLLGVSRKSFMGTLPGAADVTGRLPASLACACLAVADGAAIIRAHDVAETAQAVRMAEAVLERRRP